MANRYDPEGFTTLNYMAFEQIVRPHCRGFIEYKNQIDQTVKVRANMGTVDLYVFIRAALSDQEWHEHFSGISPADCKAALGKMRSGDMKQPYDYIVDSCREPAAFVRVKDHFEKTLLPLLNETSRTNITIDLIRVLHKDAMLPYYLQDEIMVLYETGDFLSFISKAFVIAVTRNTISETSTYIEKPEANYETDPQIERVIRELRESGQSWSFDSVLDWLYSSSLMSADELKENGYDDPEYIQWNIVAFWNTTHEYVARIELDDEAKLKYEYITRRAYHQEFHKFLRAVREIAQDLRYRYNALGEVKVFYSENEKGGWSLEYKTDCFKPDIPETK